MGILLESEPHRENSKIVSGTQGTMRSAFNVAELWQREAKPRLAVVGPPIAVLAHEALALRPFSGLAI